MMPRHFVILTLAPLLLLATDAGRPTIVHRLQAPPGGKDIGYYINFPITEEQRTKGLADARRAVALNAGKQDEAALDAYRSAKQSLPNLGDWLTMFSAGILANKGDTAEVRQMLEDLDTVLIRDWGWRTRVRSYRSAADPAGAIRLAETAAAEPGSARRRAEAWRTIGEIRLEQGDTGSARTSFARSIDESPGSDIALDAARLLAGLPNPSPAEQLRIGRTYLRFGQTDAGTRALRAYLNSPSANADTSARVRLELGRAYFGADKYTEADRVLTPLARTAPAPIAAEALFLAGRSQYRSGRAAAGKQTFVAAAQRFPDHPVAARALFMLADFAHDAQQLETANQYYRRTIAAGPGSEQAGISYMRLATSAFTRGDAAEAARILEEYRTAFPGGARNQQANYWAGRAYEQLGEKEKAAERWNEAKSRDPYTSYGVLAAKRLESQLFAELTPDPVTPATSTDAVKAALLRLELLDSIGWSEAAAFEQQRIRRFFDTDTMALYALAEGLSTRGRALSGVALGRELGQAAAMSQRLLKILYPLPYQDLIIPEARRYGIDPFFMAALIRQESSFNPRATSVAGAMGLMQVMPSTGRQLARPLGIRGFTSAMLHQPDINVRIGAKHLADAIAEWKGRSDYVLAAYNAGSTRVARWRHFPESRDPELFMERIPFDETRDYVRVVQLNARIYGALYGSDRSGAASQN
jgi:soluble lytic murein transglycosylase